MPSDAHGGTKHCAEKRHKRQMDAIAIDPLGFWIDGGDKGEFITPSDPRWDYSGVADWCHQDNIAQDQLEWYYGQVEAATKANMPHDNQSKCLGLLQGNHELKMRQKGHVNIQENICRSLEVDNLGYSTFLRITFKYCHGKAQRTILCAFKHGGGGATTTVGKLNKLRRFVNDFPTASILGVGHMHEIITFPDIHLDITQTGKIIERDRAAAVTGCYFRTYTYGLEPSYGEAQGYKPNKLGCAVWKINPDTGLIRVSEAYA